MRVGHCGILWNRPVTAVTFLDVLGLYGQAVWRTSTTTIRHTIRVPKLAIIYTVLLSRDYNLFTQVSSSESYVSHKASHK